jgi:type I restriction enzyme S subunit
MVGEWREYRIGEIADIVGGSTPSTSDPSNFNGDIPWITPKDLSGPHERYVSRGERNLSRKGLESCSAQLLPAGTVLVTSRAPIGYAAIAKNPIATNQGFRNLIPKPGFDSEFLYYWVKAHVEELQRHASGSTFQELTGTALAQIRIRVPPLPEQRAIAHILGTLDDKIELNRRMSETLEAMARALFKSWFVDFEPVRAKMEGRWQRGQSLPGLPAHLYDLFPDRLMDSELGEIPEGWEVVRLGELLELAYGKALKAEDRRNGTIPVYGSNGQVGWHNEKLVAGPGIIVGRKGNPGVVKWVPTDFFPIDTTFYVVPKDKCPSLRFLFYALERQDLASLSADSAVPGLNRNLAYMSSQILPPRTLLVAFDSAVQPVFQRAYEAERESRTLAALRDALLPKLIRGEIRVRDAERFLEERGL